MSRFAEEQVDRLIMLVQKQADDIARLTVITWTEVSEFQNSWVNYGGGSQPAAYCKDALGFVHIRGRLKSGTTDLAAFTLPAGFRPANYGCVFPSMSYDSGYVPALTVITTTGDVKPYATFPSDHLLDGITFYAG